MQSIAPNIFVADINRTIDFYTQLGFSLTMTVPPNGSDLVWAMMTNGQVNFMFQTFASLGDELPTIARRNGGSLLLYIQVEDVRHFFESIKDKVKVVKGLEKTVYGATEFSIEDNNEFLLTFAQDEQK